MRFGLGSWCRSIHANDDVHCPSDNLSAVDVLETWVADDTVRLRREIGAVSERG
jgi:hypothetical protein